MAEKMGNVWVFIEHESGKIADVSLELVSKARELADQLGLKELDIQVDGGINEKTADLVKKAGANVLVSGTTLFKAENMKQVCDELKKTV